jgi:hypothetical protein
LKSFLRVRPVFHFSERRIRAHVLLCVLAYLLENHLGQRLARAALEALETLHVVDYQLPVPTSRRIRVCTRPTPAALEVLTGAASSSPSSSPSDPVSRRSSSMLWHTPQVPTWIRGLLSKLG